MHGHAVYVKERLYFALDLSLKNPQDSYLSFRKVLIHSVSFYFYYIDEGGSLDQFIC